MRRHSKSIRSWVIEAAARRQKWIAQAQSLNIYMAGVSGKKLDETYKLAWQRGLKTTYYLRTLAATSAEKSTGAGGELNAVSSGGASTASSSSVASAKAASSAKPAQDDDRADGQGSIGGSHPDSGRGHRRTGYAC